MVSDMVGRGSFHRHTVTSGGRIARPARTAQPDSDRKLLARPAVQTAETQTAVTVVLRESSRIFTVYGPALYGAVPECTCKPQGIRIGHYSDHSWAPKSQCLPSGCAIENCGPRLCSLQCVK